MICSVLKQECWTVAWPDPFVHCWSLAVAAKCSHWWDKSKADILGEALNWVRLGQSNESFILKENKMPNLKSKMRLCVANWLHWRQRAAITPVLVCKRADYFALRGVSLHQEGENPGSVCLFQAGSPEKLNSPSATWGGQHTCGQHYAKHVWITKACWVRL